jgi:D-xylose transport system permease protein
VPSRSSTRIGLRIPTSSLNIGTVSGAVLGALVMQSLQSGMVLMGVGAPLQDIVVGIVLVIAVAIDTIYRKRVTR